ncbi:MAG: hypothetical protein JJE30_09120 [Desulfuromonadales bacterium]|nr:hypothetical protein [Desulfuromonadales bacterium]
MNNSCGSCKYGHDTKSGGGKASPGTVWCSQRNMQMGQNRPLPCFVAIGGRIIKRCSACKQAKLHMPTGGNPRLGTVWCEKKHLEINKQLSMECFE